jgi:hypothetical protein
MRSDMSEQARGRQMHVKCGERLKPFYETREPGEEIVLIEEEATLMQGDKKAAGTVKATQE